MNEAGSYHQVFSIDIINKQSLIEGSTNPNMRVRRRLVYKRSGSYSKEEKWVPENFVMFYHFRLLFSFHDKR